MATRAEILIQDLSESIGIPKLQFDAENMCTLLIDGSHQITLMANNDENLTLYGILGKYPDNPPKNFSLELLTASLLLSEIAGPYIGFEPISKALLLASTMPLDGLTSQALEQRIEDMVQMQERTKELIASKDVVLEPLEA